MDDRIEQILALANEVLQTADLKDKLFLATELTKLLMENEIKPGIYHWHIASYMVNFKCK